MTYNYEISTFMLKNRNPEIPNCRIQWSSWLYEGCYGGDSVRPTE